VRLVPGREVAHAAANGVLEAGLFYEGAVDVEEPVVGRASVLVEQDLDGAEPLVDEIEERAVMIAVEHRSDRSRRPTRPAR
jgi:hypothetical protein